MSVAGSAVQQLSATADLFATAGNAISGGFAVSTFVKGGTLGPCKASATAANRTWQLLTNSSTGALDSTIRGTTTNNATGDLCDGRWHWIAYRINGSVVDIWVDGVRYTPTVGAAAEEAEVITLGARTNSAAAAHLTGFQWDVAIPGYALSDAQMAQLNSWGRAYFGSP